jgi:hypothetical protein
VALDLSAELSGNKVATARVCPDVSGATIGTTELATFSA